MIIAVKHFHMLCALLSIAGFALRSVWLLRGSALFRARATRVLPHIVDTGLLISAISLLWLYQWHPLHQPWLVAKLVALPVYIGLGVLAFRVGRSPAQRAVFAGAALLTAIYILGVALTKSPTLQLV